MSYGAPNLPADKHFFFDRHGGVSAGKYASLNGSIKSDDDRENVLKNFALAAAHYHLPFERLAIVRQGTTNHAVFISQPEHWQQFADGMVTDIPGIILTLRTADCCPVFISASSIDTYRSEDYFSYRRNTHRGLLNSRYDYPTHLSTITL